jgi:hypothetical protein
MRLLLPAFVQAAIIVRILDTKRPIPFSGYDDGLAMTHE